MDALPIEVVLDAAADCSDRDRAAALLAASLSAARGPRRSKTSAKHWWQLDVNVSPAAPGVKAAEARIVDDAGELVARRSLSDKTTGSCVALVRAVSAWAQIVLDDELVRAHDEPSPAATAASRPLVAAGVVSRPGGAAAATASNDGDKKADAEPSESRTVEIGTMLFLRNGVATKGGVFGASPFMTIGIAKTWVIRPATFIGTSTSEVPPDESRRANFTAIGGRLDFCKRMPGNYIDHRGIELDACAGADLFYVWSELVSAVRSSVGPSLVLRGELGANFGLEIRGMLGANLARGSVGADASFFVASAELGGSVRF